MLASSLSYYLLGFYLTKTMEEIIYVPSDVVTVICYFLQKDSDTICYLSTCKRYHSVKQRVLFHKKVRLETIVGLTYYNQFTHIVASDSSLKLLNQSYFKKDKLTLPSNTVELTLQKYQGYLKTITRGLKHLKQLRLLNGCKITTRPGCLPKKLTHLTWETNQPLTRDVLPEGLLVLRVDYYRHDNMNLPSTLKSLQIGRQFNMKHTRFNRIYPGMLPDGLETLHLDSIVDITDEVLPLITRIIFGPHLTEMMRANILNNLTQERQMALMQMASLNSNQ